MKRIAGAGSCYIGKLVKDEVDEEQPFIKYIQASSGDEFMLDKILAAGEGVSHGVWTTEEPEEGEEPEEAETEQKPLRPLHIKNVLRRADIRYFKVPSLGSYLACPFVYDSALNQICVAAQLAAPKPEDVLTRDAVIEGEEEEGVGEKEDAPPLLVLPKKTTQLYVAFDTLADNAASPEGFGSNVQETLQSWVDALGPAMDRSDEEALKKECATLMAAASANEAALAALRETEEAVKQALDEKIAELPEDTNEEARELAMGRHQLVAASNEVSAMQEAISAFSSHRVQPRLQVIKIFKAVLYLLGYTNTSVLQTGSKKIDWPKMRQLLNAVFFQNIAGFDAEIERQAASYATSAALRELLEGVVADEINAESVGVGALYRFCTFAIQVGDAAAIKRKKEIEEAALKAAAEAEAKVAEEVAAEAAAEEEGEEEAE